MDGLSLMKRFLDAIAIAIVFISGTAVLGTMVWACYMDAATRIAYMALAGVGCPCLGLFPRRSNGHQPQKPGNAISTNRR